MIDLSVIFFSYNRTGYLAQTIYDFLRRCAVFRSRMELIISDDGSKYKHIPRLKQIADKFGITKLLLSEHGGMGASFNTGIRAATGKYILHLQDDWSLMKTSNFAQNAMGILESDPNIAMVRLAMLGNEMTRFNPNGQKPVEYSVGDKKVAAVDLSQDFYVYSDNPHIKSKRFHEEFGYYKEVGHPEHVEKDMCTRFNAQSRWRITWLGEYFQHTGQFSSMPGRNWPGAPNIPMHYDEARWKARDV